MSERNDEPYHYLNRIDSPADLRQLKEEELVHLCAEVRDYLIDTVASTGGHFASNLGVVELTVALHFLFNTPEDRIIWDVGHQTYPHKILTGRRQELSQVRRYGGISGFPKREESPYDTFNSGHAGSSISLMLGEALARDRLGLKHKCISVIGDASIGAGMALEALNHGGHIKPDCLVILNDNDMSISHNVGALNRYFNGIITSPAYGRWRKLFLTLLLWLPVVGPAVQMFFKKLELSFKHLWTPGSLFSDLGFSYVGPVNGHNLKELLSVLRKAALMRGPVLLHVYTQKGRGFRHAENNPTDYHSVSVFDRKSGITVNRASRSIAFSQIVGRTLVELVEKNKRVIAITPAMIEGSGLRPLFDAYPEHVIDVGIAEQHATTLAGAMASAGMVPYLCIYSTFLVRAMDQLIQDIALMRHPVRIVIDRAGCVGPDGETHQGLFDPGVILAVPGVRLYAPATGVELRSILHAVVDDSEGPLAIRFPRADAPLESLTADLVDVESLTPSIEGEGSDLAVLTIGTAEETGRSVVADLAERGIDATLVGIRWVRPFDQATIEAILARCRAFVMIEDAYLSSSASSYLRGRIRPELAARHIGSFGFPEEEIIHGTRDEIFAHYGLDAASISDSIAGHTLFALAKARGIVQPLKKISL